MLILLFMHSVVTCTYFHPFTTTKVLVGKLQRLRLHQYFTLLFLFPEHINYMELLFLHQPNGKTLSH